MTHFTPLELDILECLASHWSQDDICEEIGGSRTKTLSYLARLREKLAVPPADCVEDRPQAHMALCDRARLLFHRRTLYTLHAEVPDESR